MISRDERKRLAEEFASLSEEKLKELMTRYGLGQSGWKLVGFDEENGFGLPIYQNNDLYVWRNPTEGDFDEILVVTHDAYAAEDKRFEVFAVDEKQVLLFREWFDNVGEARDCALKFMGLYDEDE